jgi:hypothetical protein
MFFSRTRTAQLSESAHAASELALQLARDKRFRRRLLSALEHGSEAGRRARPDRLEMVRRLASDRVLQAELRQAQSDLAVALSRLAKKRRRHRLRNLLALAGVASIAAIPTIRNRFAALLPARDGIHRRDVANEEKNQPKRSSRLEDLTKDELYARAQDADIAGRSEMSKEELIAALRARR